MQTYYPPRFCLIVLLSVLVGALIITSGCTGTEGTPPGTVSVAVTIPPQEEMVREIGGRHVEVVVMMPPGSDPHTYEPGPAVVAEAAGADLYIAIGTGLLPVEDALVARIRAMNPDLTVVDASRGVTYLYPEGAAGSESGGISREPPDGPGRAATVNPDPHVWLSLRNAFIMSENTRDALIIADPGHEDEYRENCDRYTARLIDLDQGITAMFARDDPGILLVTHQAWEYFARDYDLNLVAIEQEGKEPTARELESIIILSREAGVRVVFAEAAESPRGAETIAREIGGSVRVIDPLAGDYLANMKRISEAFAEAGAP